MQNLKKLSESKLLNTPLLALFLLLIFTSCSKNIAEYPGQDKAGSAALSQSSGPQIKNGLASTTFDETLFVPCANGGAGENIRLTGTSNFVYQMAWNDHGFTLVYHSNARGVTGTGLSSGETFTGTEGVQGTVTGSWVNNQWIGTTSEQMRIIGQNTNYVVKYKCRLVVTPDGKVTVNKEEELIECLR